MKYLNKNHVFYLIICKPHEIARVESTIEFPGTHTYEKEYIINWPKIPRTPTIYTVYSDKGVLQFGSTYRIIYRG